MGAWYFLGDMRAQETIRRTLQYPNNSSLWIRLQCTTLCAASGKYKNWEVQGYLHLELTTVL